jgi:hypothetical protein
MADSIRNAAEAAKDAVSKLTESVASTSIKTPPATADTSAGKLIKDKETGEMISKTECESPPKAAVNCPRLTHLFFSQSRGERSSVP